MTGQNNSAAGVHKLALALSLVLAAGGLRAGEKPGLPRASFASKPQVKKKGSGCEISFSVGSRTDVAVEVIRNGKVVRHLAAGVLGQKPPAPLRPGLKQTLTWDGRDDAGRPVAPAGCTVRVGLGLKPKFDRILGWKGEAIGPVFGLTVDEKGRLYVLSTEYKKPTRITVLTREGKYVKALLPYPTNLPYEKVKALKHIEIAGGQRIPIIRDPMSFTLYPHAYSTYPCGSYPTQTMALLGDRLAFVNSASSKSLAPLSERRVMLVGRDGSIPEKHLGPILTGKKTAGQIHLAAAPYGKHVLASGFREKGGKKGKPHNVVYRIARDGTGPAQAYLGELNKSGSDKAHFDDPRGIAVDRHGNLYVADNGNNRIVVFDKKGAFLGQVPAEAPDQLAVHQRTCAIYVRCGKELVKISPAVSPAGKWAGGASKVVGRTGWRRYAALAVDGTREPTVIWVGGRVDWKCRFLRRIEEKDGKFGRPQPLLPTTDPSLTYGGFLTVDRQREEVYVHNMGSPGYGPVTWCVQSAPWTRINGRTGEMSQLKVKAAEMAVGPEGCLYVHGGNKLSRLDRDGKPRPFPGTGTHVLAQGNCKEKGATLSFLHGFGGFCVDPRGNTYVMYPYPTGKYVSPHSLVDVYGPDGKLKKKGLIVAGSSDECVRVDPRGNIYLCSNIKAKEAIYPPEFRGKLPNAVKWEHGVNWYGWYGSIIKFPPTGGSNWGSKGQAHVSAWGYGKSQPKVENALWLHTGIFPTPCITPYQYFRCSCFGPRFDVDGFGRVFMPDAATFSVRVIDTNANPIARFGSYGNMDSAGPKSAIPEPAIPFAWPQYVAVSNEAVYVSDVINRRVVRVKLEYAAEETCPIR